MTDIRRSLRELWQADDDIGSLHLDLLPQIRARMRRRRVAASGAAGLAVVAILGAGVLVTGQLVDQPRPLQPGTTSEPTPPVSLLGVPPYLRLTDPVAAAAMSPSLANVPSGSAMAYIGAGGPITRVIAVIDFSGESGLPGKARDVQLTSLPGAKVLSTDDDASSTAYLKVWAFDGRSWFIAVTAASTEERTAALDRIASATIR
ncbi:MAG TPA: hypothetical protein VFX61_22965 [Micromonosporaceae bacterium]|nr:hypothetical protein [Micromonosporaceae bacterium]